MENLFIMFDNNQIPSVKKVVKEKRSVGEFLVDL